MNKLFLSLFCLKFYNILIMKEFIHSHWENTCQQDFWKITNNDDDDEAENQIESQTAEAFDNFDFAASVSE